MQHSDSDRAFEDWDAIAARVRQNQGQSETRLQALLGAITLAASSAPRAVALSRELAQESTDQAVVWILGRSASDTWNASTPSVRGELISHPRGWFAIVLRGVTGVALASSLGLLFAKLVLSYRCPAEITIAANGVQTSLEIRWRIEMLGRTLREHAVIVPVSELRSVGREVRYPFLGLYVGLVALAVGSYFGISAVTDGLRVGSASLLLMGLAVIAAGLALDFVLWTFSSGKPGSCRISLVPRRGRSFCIGGMEVVAADELLTRLSKRQSSG
jgi:hypothetical protein